MAARRLLLLLLAGCAAGGTREEEWAMPAMTIEAALHAHRDTLMAVPGVVGTAIGRCDGVPCIRVFLSGEDPAARRRIPDRLGGHPVRVEVTGLISPRPSP